MSRIDEIRARIDNIRMLALAASRCDGTGMLLRLVDQDDSELVACPGCRACAWLSVPWLLAHLAASEAGAAAMRAALEAVREFFDSVGGDGWGRSVVVSALATDAGKDYVPRAETDTWKTALTRIAAARSDQAAQYLISIAQVALSATPARDGGAP